MPRGVKKLKRPSPSIPRDPLPSTLHPATSAGVRFTGLTVKSDGEDGALITELDQRTRTLQLPAACSFVFGLIERYVRSKSSHDSSSSTSLPNKEALLSLVDSYILKVPKATSGSGNNWPFNVFEELELLDLLRVQIEERQSIEVQLALFDALFGLNDREKVHAQHCLRVMHKVVSLCISMGCTVVLQCVACWMEFYPLHSMDLSKYIYFEFCELLPSAMDPLMSLSSVATPFARLLTYHLTLHYHIYSSNNRSLSSIPLLCPPLPLITLFSQWLSSSPEFLYIQTPLVGIRENSCLLRSHRPRTLTPSPLTGLVQWCVMEPLLSDDQLSQVPSLDYKGSELVSKLRSHFSELHANILSCVMALVSSASIVNLITMEGLVQLVTNVVDLIQLVKCDNEHVERCIDRFAQVLQAGLSVGVIHTNLDTLSPLLSKLPQNRLLKLVLARQRTSQRARDH